MTATGRGEPAGSRRKGDLLAYDIAAPFIATSGAVLGQLRPFSGVRPAGLAAPTGI